MVRKETTSWVGWVYFTSALLIVNGAISIITGLTGIFNSKFFLTTTTGKLLVFNYATWGWLYLIFGVAVIAAGAALLAGKTWARIFALILIVISALGNIVEISTYPWWSITMLVLSGILFYALTMHGDEVRE